MIGFKRITYSLPSVSTGQRFLNQISDLKRQQRDRQCALIKLAESIDKIIPDQTKFDKIKQNLQQLMQIDTILRQRNDFERILQT